jgi:hypothetical protein
MLNKTYISKILCIAVAVGAWNFQEVEAQRPTRNSKDRRPASQQGDTVVQPETVIGRPDIGAVHPSAAVPKLRENRHFNRAGTEEFRTYNGMFNNVDRPEEGSIFIELIRIAPSAYGPFNGLARHDMPSARVISNEVLNQNASQTNDRQLTDFVWQWGQFIDHDLDLTEAQLPQEPAPIAVAAGDPVFDPGSLGNVTLPFSRSLYRIDPDHTLLVRQQLNQITAWIDASMVFGSDQDRAHSLRTFTDGLMKTSKGGLFLPLNDDGTKFLAGDIRVTEQTCLAAIHTLFVREHNRLAAEIRADHPDFTDEEIYQKCRKEIYAIIEAITYNEWLPALLGPDNPLNPYAGYNPSISPNIANSFSTAAFRLGHTLLNNQLLRLNNDGTSIEDGPLLLRDAFFNPATLLDYGLEPYLKGLATQRAQELDAQVVGAVRNFLFGNVNGFGMDLGSLNIQRGRDHGLPDFNTLRISFGLAPLNSFAELTADPLLRAKLASVYPSIDDLDPWVGCVAEDHAPNSSCGPTIIAIIKNQFERTRDADRFWYENVYSGEELESINNTTLADVIRRNTTLTNLQDNVFVNN